MLEKLRSESATRIDLECLRRLCETLLFYAVKGYFNTKTARDSVLMQFDMGALECGGLTLLCYRSC